MPQAAQEHRATSSSGFVILRRVGVLLSRTIGIGNKWHWNSRFWVNHDSFSKGKHEQGDSVQWFH